MVGFTTMVFYFFFVVNEWGVNGEALEPLDVRALCREMKNTLLLDELLIGGQYSGCVLLTQLLGIKCHLF